MEFRASVRVRGLWADSEAKRLFGTNVIYKSRLLKHDLLPEMEYIFLPFFIAKKKDDDFILLIRGNRERTRVNFLFPRYPLSLFFIIRYISLQSNTEPSCRW